MEEDKEWKKLSEDLIHLVESCPYGLPLVQIEDKYREHSGRNLDEFLEMYGFPSRLELLSAVGISCVTRQVVVKQFRLPWHPQCEAGASGEVKPLDENELVLAFFPDDPEKQPLCQHSSTPTRQRTRPRTERQATASDLPSGAEEEGACASLPEPEPAPALFFDQVVSSKDPFNNDKDEETPKPPRPAPRRRIIEIRPRPPPDSHEVRFVTEPDEPGIVRPLESEDPIKGRIRLLKAEYHSFIRGQGSNRLEPWLWQRICNILSNYASRDQHHNQEWLLLETFEQIYFHIFGEQFKQPEWTESDLMVIFSWFDFIVHLDVDAAGFAWTNFKEITTKEDDDKVSQLQNEAKAAWQRFQEEEPTIVPNHLQNHSCVLKNNIFSLLLEYFPFGMDCLQLSRVYEAKFSRGPPLRFQKNLFEFCTNDLADVCKFDQKSPVHGILYPRLDVNITPRNYFSLEETEKEVKRKLEWRQYRARPRVPWAQRT